MNEVEVVNERQRDPEERAEEEWRVRKRESWFLHSSPWYKEGCGE